MPYYLFASVWYLERYHYVFGDMYFSTAIEIAERYELALNPELYRLHVKACSEAAYRHECNAKDALLQSSQLSTSVDSDDKAEAVRWDDLRRDDERKARELKDLLPHLDKTLQAAIIRWENATPFVGI